MKLDEFIKNIAVLSKNKIMELINSQYSNEAKKQKLDDFIYNYIEKYIGKVKMNFVTGIIFKSFLLPNVSKFTQIIYDLLKAGAKEFQNG